MLFHCHLVYILSNEKSAVSFIEDYLYVKSQFSLAAFKTLFKSLFFYSLSKIYLVADFFEFIHWAYWMYRLMFSSSLGICGHYFFKYFFYFIPSLCSGNPTMQWLMWLIVFHSFLRLCLLFLFLFCSQNWSSQVIYIQFYWFCFQPIQSCYWTLLVIFSSIYCTFQLQNLYIF